MSQLKIVRFCYSHIGTFGRLYLNNAPFCYTVELPWRDNKQNVSCVPEGEYKLNYRRSGVVYRTSRNKYESGWEVAPVEGRTYIMFHPGNTVDDLQGCIAVGRNLGMVSGKWAVIHSQAAFKSFMSALKTDEEHSLIIEGGKL